MSCGEYTIIYSEDDICQIKEILEISLNIIFFHRYLGSQNFEDVQSKLNNISYVKIKNEKLSKDLISIINTTENNLKNNNNQYAQKLTLSFYQNKNDKKGGNKPWEIWNFILRYSKKEDLKEKNELEKKKKCDEADKIREYIFKVIEKLNDIGD